jgi:hypothetical protein
MQSVPRNEIKIFLLIILLGILLYAHHLHHPFQFDSLGAIKKILASTIQPNYSAWIFS